MITTKSESQQQNHQICAIWMNVVICVCVCVVNQSMVFMWDGDIQSMTTTKYALFRTWFCWIQVWNKTEQAYCHCGSVSTPTIAHGFRWSWVNCPSWQMVVDCWDDHHPLTFAGAPSSVCWFILTPFPSISYFKICHTWKANWPRITALLSP